MGIGALLTQSVSSTAQDNIEGAKEEPEPKQGMVSKVFGGLTDRMKKLGGSLGGVAKFLLKGAALAGLIFLFKRNEETITKAIASVFKFFHDLAKSMKDSDDPLGDLIKFMKDKLKKWGENLTTMAQEFLDDTLKPMTESFISWLWENLKVFINETLGIKLFDVKGDREVRRKAKDLTSIDDTFTTIKTETGLEDLGTFKGLSMGKVESEGEGVAGTRNKTNAVVLERLNKMKEITNASDGRIQWTGLGFRMGGDINLAMLAAGIKELPIATIMSSEPILDNQMLKVTDLQDKDFSLLKSAGVTKESNPENVDAIMANLAKVARYQRFISEGKVSGSDQGKTGPLVFGEFNYQEKIDELLAENENKYLANQKLMTEFYNVDLLPDKKLTDDANNAMMNEGSIFTHDTHLQKLIEPVSQAFENGGGSGTVIMDNSSNNNSVTKQGDNIQMALGVHSSDPTANAFHEWKYA
jgi:hypothetical protein